MVLYDTFFIALGLSLDSFAVAITAGLILKNVRLQYALVISLYMAFFQAVMPIVGWLVGSELVVYVKSISYWFAGVLLFCVGAKMMYDTLIKKNKYCFNPRKQKVLIGLAFTTSIDALIVGVDFGILSTSLSMPVIVIGFVTFAMSFVGVYLGAKFSKLYYFKVEAIGGAILMGMAVKILLRHL